jgi:Di-haem oxidoreductase, putative peroxidase
MNGKRDRLGSRFVVNVSVILAFWLAAGAAQAPAQEGLSHAEDPALSRRLKRIDQDRLLLGEYTLREVTENGRHLFTTPFTKLEGYGEGGKPVATGGFLIGPREVAFRQNLDAFRVQTKSQLTDDQLRQFLNFPVPEVNPSTQKIVYPYVRLNGLDSQSCWECHNFIGSERLPDTRSYALSRKQSASGGAGGFAGNAFINTNLPNPIFMFIRNAPHVFGSGYAQELAEEMTLDLLGLRTIALRDALANPGVAASQPLKAKTIDFGSFVVTYIGDPANKPGLKTVIDELNNLPGQDPPGFKIQWDKIQGVSADLVVRPFQFKGIASNTRNFVRDACNFHFGMEPREINPGFDTPSENHDSDNDGVPDELSLGDVSALTVYTMTVRPPFQVQSRDDLENRLAQRGRSIFEGNEIFTKAVSCARCHTPSLHLIDSIAVVQDPRKDGANFGPEQLVGNGIGLPAQLKSSAQLPVVRRFMTLDPVAVVANRDAGTALNALHQAWTRYELSFLELPDNRLDAYAFNLTTLQPVNRLPNSPPEPSALSETQPRLSASGQTIEVPLFSDLRRHKMGNGLAERAGFRQPTDVAGLVVAEDEFLTRPLWGVGDTGPWLHDGRAQSLEEAILLHRSEGSEANDVIDAYTKLPRGDQDAIIKFLLTLRLPLDPRYDFDDYR